MAPPRANQQEWSVRRGRDFAYGSVARFPASHSAAKGNIGVGAMQAPASVLSEDAARWRCPHSAAVSGRRSGPASVSLQTSCARSSAPPRQACPDIPPNPRCQGHWQAWVLPSLLGTRPTGFGVAPEQIHGDVHGNSRQPRPKMILAAKGPAEDAAICFGRGLLGNIHRSAVQYAPVSAPERDCANGNAVAERPCQKRLLPCLGHRPPQRTGTFLRFAPAGFGHILDNPWPPCPPHSFYV